ncbi:TrmH family RNA methyltransferase [Mycoplasma buteonis]|uniref:TrmH family RNA methyltransferase n=1 Tax=Mycoplasma buteonis TaxID=171280 RepID=UPI0005641163|nr:RNA methyltransferase [Mycoplasma buteonis]
MILTSKSNSKVKFWKKLREKKYRDLENLYLIDGYHLVEEARKQNLLVETIELIGKARFSDSIQVTEDILKYLSSTVTPQSIIGVVQKRKNQIKPIHKVVALNNLQDPGNVGTIIRLAKAFEFDTVLVENLDPYNDKVIRASQGAFFDVNILETKNIAFNLQKLKEKGFFVYETLLDQNAKKLAEVSFPNDKLVIVLGNEGNGISQQVKELSDTNVYIPIAFESLNVACAAAIIMERVRNS